MNRMEEDPITTIRGEIKEVDNKNITPEDFERLILTNLKLRDVTAFDYVYKRWGKPLLRFLSNYIGMTDVAEDICQETFTKLWLNCDSIDPDKSIKTYLYLISKQLALNYIRDRKRKNIFILDTEIDDYDHVSPDKIMEMKEMETTVDETINKFPPQMCKVFDLFFTQNLSYKQIASILSMSPNNVAVQIHKARTKLEEELYLLR